MSQRQDTHMQLEGHSPTDSSVSHLEEEPKGNRQGSSSDEQQKVQNPFVITSKPIIKKDNYKCTNKLCPSKGDKVVRNEGFPEEYLCQPCNERFKDRHYCKYCYQIYFLEADGNNWIECDSCLRWTHEDCEQKMGDPNIKDKTNTAKDFPYECPECRTTKIAAPLKKPSICKDKDREKEKDPLESRNWKDKNKFAKRDDRILNSYGFFWKLKPEDVQSDIERLRRL